MRVKYSPGVPLHEGLDRMPMLPVTLALGPQSVDVIGLVDSGSRMNVIPYHVGLELGAVWDDARVDVSLGGTFSGISAIAIVVSGQVGHLPPVN